MAWTDRWSEVRADWRFTAGLFFITVLLETAAFGQLTAFTPLYIRQAIQLPGEEIPSWTGVLVATSLAVAVPLASWWGVLADRCSRKRRLKHESDHASSLIWGRPSVCRSSSRSL